MMVVSNNLLTFTNEKLTIIEWEDGEITEERVYTDDFENGEIYDVESMFPEVPNEVSDTSSDQDTPVDFDP